MVNQKITNAKMELSCPVPISDYKNVLLAHGGGGRLSHQIIQKMFVSQFHNDFLDQSHDGATIPVNGSRQPSQPIRTSSIQFFFREAISGCSP